MTRKLRAGLSMLVLATAATPAVADSHGSDATDDHRVSDATIVDPARRERPLFAPLPRAPAPREPVAPTPAPVDDAPDVDDGAVHWAETAVWSALLFGIPAAYYWNTQSAQEVDWTHPSLTDKLTLRAFTFDTNAFHVNAVRHPAVGVGDYQIARSNGFGVVGATAFAWGTGILWEFAVEYHENPAINDIVMNGAGGLAIGEPLYQIGQLWRGGEQSVGDRIRAAAFSPFASTQDLWRSHRNRVRRKAWSDFGFTAGMSSHRLANDTTRSEVALGLDIDVVRNRGFVAQGAYDGRVRVGEWSRVAIDTRLADAGTGGSGGIVDGLVTASFRTRTSLYGRYTQDDAGDGRMIALGTAFTYRRDQIGDARDHLAIAHLLGPQLQLSRRTGGAEIRWDVAAYADFGMVDAFAFGPDRKLPPPPPYLSTLQVNGYYDGAGATVESRLRVDRGPWHADFEVAGHQLWSLDFADRVRSDGFAQATMPVVEAEAAADDLRATPHGVADTRVYSRAQVGARSGRYGVAATADAGYRRGTWRNLNRSATDWAIGLVGTADL